MSHGNTNDEFYQQYLRDYLQEILRDVSFPASREEVASSAERNGAPRQVVQPIRNASVERFNSLDEVRFHLPYIKFGNGGGPPGDSTSKAPRDL